MRSGRVNTSCYTSPAGPVPPLGRPDTSDEAQAKGDSTKTLTPKNAIQGALASGGDDPITGSVVERHSVVRTPLLNSLILSSQSLSPST